MEDSPAGPAGLGVMFDVEPSHTMCSFLHLAPHLRAGYRGCDLSWGLEVEALKSKEGQG